MNKSKIINSVIVGLGISFVVCLINLWHMIDSNNYTFEVREETLIWSIENNDYEYFSRQISYIPQDKLMEEPYVEYAAVNQYYENLFLYKMNKDTNKESHYLNELEEAKRLMGSLSFLAEDLQGRYNIVVE